MYDILKEIYKQYNPWNVISNIVNRHMAATDGLTDSERRKQFEEHLWETL